MHRSHGLARITPLKHTRLAVLLIISVCGSWATHMQALPLEHQPANRASEAGSSRDVPHSSPEDVHVGWREAAHGAAPAMSHAHQNGVQVSIEPVGSNHGSHADTTTSGGLPLTQATYHHHHHHHQQSVGQQAHHQGGRRREAAAQADVEGPGHARTMASEHVEGAGTHSGGAPSRNSRATASTPQQQSPSPRIYVYNVSAHFRLHNGHLQYDYMLEMLLPEMLFGSEHITQDPEQADYFYVWAWLYHRINAPEVHKRRQDAAAAASASGTAASHAPLSEFGELVDELRAVGPYWDRKSGADHIVVFTADLGACHMQPMGIGSILELQQAMRMQHWGGALGFQLGMDCTLLHKWPEHCDQGFQIAGMWDQVLAGSSAPPAVREYAEPCYKKGRDLVVPGTAAEAPATTRFLNPTLDALPRNTTMFFGGSIDGMAPFLTPGMTPERAVEAHAWYSGGVRQTFARMFRAEPGFKIVDKHDKGMAYWHDMHSSLFCLAPPGYGWGTRVKTSLTRGCIPVIVQDGVKVEWEDEIKGGLFELALRVPSAMMHRLPAILRVVQTSGRADHMLRNIRCAW
eukprot:CAMPEP_0202903500 /NCGR_PEP_ID=MMETSP1392-20130828/24758_1 /ASSEMBLY_ACC=CAM_ASM_000868 /TAXON_ID=225041 /ORGANISM="Chlamydomonas chlamydogama, Strain SAG 11-48b" /LENGTH=572 /DNA_ID=CAMNT_0049590715 /DNA_START=1 /DNA_END=1716 /DNA_ORIENTATION=-